MNGARETRTRREFVAVESKSDAREFRRRRRLSFHRDHIALRPRRPLPRTELAQHTFSYRVRVSARTTLTPSPLEWQDCDREGLADFL